MKVGDWVRITSRRPLIERFHGMRGTIATMLPRQDLVYVRLAKYTPIFYRDEVTLCDNPNEVTK